jgi:regulatory protein
MLIEVRPKLENKDVLIIFIDEEPRKQIHVTVFGKNPSFPSKVESLEEWQTFFEAAEYRCAKNYVLRRLAMQNYYSIQLEKLLKERFISQATIQRLMAECLSWGYLNDQAWLDSFMRTHIKRNSLRAISMKLQAKLVSPEIIQELMEQWRNPQDEERSVRRILETRYKNKNLEDFKERQKVIAALARKGYSFEVIRSALGD